MTAAAAPSHRRRPKPPKAEVPIPGTLGLRERKKLKTRDAIQRAAIRLFQRQGYERTTVEEIAAAAEISPSTFFNYFRTKEDVVMLDVYDPMTLALLEARPKDEPLSAVLRAVLQGLSGFIARDKEVILARARILMEEPALRSRMWDEVERTQALLVPIVARRCGRDADDFEVRIVVRAMIAGMYEAAMNWFRTGGRDDITRLMSRALDVMDVDARLDALQRGGARRRSPFISRTSRMSTHIRRRIP